MRDCAQSSNYIKERQYNGHSAIHRVHYRFKLEPVTSVKQRGAVGSFMLVAKCRKCRVSPRGHTLMYRLHLVEWDNEVRRIGDRENGTYVSLCTVVRLEDRECVSAEWIAVCTTQRAICSVTDKWIVRGTTRATLFECHHLHLSYQCH